MRQDMLSILRGFFLTVLGLVLIIVVMGLGARFMFWFFDLVLGVPK